MLAAALDAPPAAEVAPAAAAAGPLAFVPAAPEPDEAPPYLDASFNGVRMIPAAFDAVTDYDENYDYELVNAVVVATPPPADRRAALIDSLGGLLWDYRLNHPDGAALDLALPGRYVATSWGRRKADRVLWCGLGRRPNSAVDPPSVVVEVVSPRRRDRVRDYELKRDEYREVGVLEYWLVDPRGRPLTTFTAAGNWAENTLRAGETLATPLLPGFELPVDTLLEVADFMGHDGDPDLPAGTEQR